MPSDVHTIVRELREEGFSRIEVGAELRERIEDFYFDICTYLLICIEDGKVQVDKEAHAGFAEAVSGRNLDRCNFFFQAISGEINRIDRPTLGLIYDMGTRPNRFLSGDGLFFDATIQSILRQRFPSDGKRSLLVKPSNGETLHVFPPGESNFRFNLPIHQDYPYLLQSADQLTFWLNLTDNSQANAGGIRLFEGTHHTGVAAARKDARGHWEIDAEKYPSFDERRCTESSGAQFELFVTDSLTWHSSIRNESQDAVRMTYIFRVSDIGGDKRVPFGLDALHPKSATTRK